MVLNCLSGLSLAAQSDSRVEEDLRQASQLRLAVGDTHQALLILQRADSLQRANLQRQNDNALAARELENQNHLEKQSLKVLEWQSNQQRKKLWFISTLSFLILLGGGSIYFLLRDAHRKKKALLQTKAEQLSLEESTLRNQMKKRQAERQLLEQELSKTNARKSTFHGIIEEQNLASQRLRTLLKSYRQSIANDQQRQELSALNLQMAQQSQRHRQQERFQAERGKLSPQLRERVHQHFNYLKGSEIKLLIYILNGLSISEIADIYQVQAESINKRRYRLRKKLAVPRQQEFKSYILQQLKGDHAEG